MKKLTKRKAFNFLRSYFDVLNELEKDKDKLDFLLAVINKQFLDEEPDLKGMARFAYISQSHAIETSVKGWKDATGQALTGAYVDPLEGVTPPPLQEEQDKEEGEEQEKEKEKKKKEKLFDFFWDKYDYKKSKDVAFKKWMKLKDADIEKIMEVVDDYVKSTPDKNFRKHPATWLNQKCWNDEIIFEEEIPTPRYKPFEKL